MKASVQWLTVNIGLVRIHPEGDYGDRWTWGCCVVVVGDEATIYLAERAPTLKEVAALRRLFVSIEVDSVLWERRDDNGGSVMKRFKIKR